MLYLMDVNFLTILLATALNVILGAIWYSPRFLGTMWSKAHNLNVREVKTPMHYIGAILVAFVTAWILSAFISSLNIDTGLEGMKVAFFAWLGFIATTHFSGVLWAKKHLDAYLIDVGFLLVSMLIMGAIFGYWG
jgi:Protein of unknown function (DUF1761)